MDSWFLCSLGSREGSVALSQAVGHSVHVDSHSQSGSGGAWGWCALVRRCGCEGGVPWPVSVGKRGQQWHPPVKNIGLWLMVADHEVWHLCTGLPHVGTLTCSHMHPWSHWPAPMLSHLPSDIPKGQTCRQESHPGESLHGCGSLMTWVPSPMEHVMFLHLADALAKQGSLS